MGERNETGRGDRRLQNATNTKTMTSRRGRGQMRRRRNVSTSQIRVSRHPPKKRIRPTKTRRDRHHAKSTRNVRFLLTPILVNRNVMRASRRVSTTRVRERVTPIPLANRDRTRRRNDFVNRRNGNGTRRSTPPNENQTTTMPRNRPRGRRRQRNGLSRVSFAMRQMAPRIQTGLHVNSVMKFPRIIRIFFRPFQTGSATGYTGRGRVYEGGYPGEYVYTGDIMFWRYVSGFSPSNV